MLFRSAQTTLRCPRIQDSWTSPSRTLSILRSEETDAAIPLLLLMGPDIHHPWLFRHPGRKHHVPPRRRSLFPLAQRPSRPVAQLLPFLLEGEARPSASVKGWGGVWRRTPGLPRVCLCASEGAVPGWVGGDQSQGFWLPTPGSRKIGRAHV